jgi:Calx-beta domain
MPPADTVLFAKITGQPMSFRLPSSRRGRPAHSRLRLEILEVRAVPAVTQFGGDPQHSGISAVASQSVDTVHWQTFVDPNFNATFGHYGSPVITAANTVVYPLKTNSNPPNFHVIGRNGNDGSQLWDVTTDWAPADFDWYPPFQPVLSTFNNRVYFAGAGGTIYYRTNPDSATGTVTQLAFYGNLGDYTNNQAVYNANVFVDTPLTVDNSGNVYFGFRVTGANPANLVSGIARIAADGTGIWTSAQAAAGGDTSINQAARFSAPALSNDGATLYLGVGNSGTQYYGRLVGLNAATLAPLYITGALVDPRNGNNAGLLTDSTASPTVAPDGRVFYGVFGNPDGGYRGWLLQFSGDLTTEYAPGGFGWDDTVSIVPASMVPQYTGTSTYLLFTKYNNYYYGDGDGSNKIAILDPKDTQVDTHPSANGQLIMKVVLYKVGPTPDSEFPGVPTAVREWCINDAAVDPATDSVLVNSEDGNFYRWYLPTNTLTQAINLTSGIGEPYTMTVIGMDGTMYGMEDGILFALGQTPGLSISDTAVNNAGTTATFTVSLDFPRTTAITVHYATADGSAVAGSQYTATSGDLTFTPGQKSQTINVSVTPGSFTGSIKSFFVNLTSPSGAVMADSQGRADLLGRPPRVQSVVVNGGDAQRSRVTSVAVTFDQIVTLPATPANAFQLFRQIDGAPVTMSAVVNNSGAGTVATLSFIGGAVEFGSLADGRYTLIVSAGSVSTVAGSLDGDNNGVGGDNYVLASASMPDPPTNIFRIYGDINGDGFVGANDFAVFRLFFNSSNAAFDFNNDGFIGTNDFAEFRQRFNSSI